MIGEGCDVRSYSVFALDVGSCACRIVKGHQPSVSFTPCEFHFCTRKSINCMLNDVFRVVEH